MLDDYLLDDYLRVCGRPEPA